MQSFVTQNPFTDPGPQRALIDGLPSDIAGLCRIVQGLLIHDSMGQRLYGPPPAGFGTASRETLLVAERLAAILRDGPRDLRTPRPPFARAVGTCRDFALLLCALLRHQGVPARLRCGFAGYFHPPTFEDHWVCEYRHADARRWALADAQLDEAHRRHFAIAFDVTDVPEAAFVFPWQAWRACRGGASDPADYGHGADNGTWFLRVNLVRDLLALGGEAVSAWDGWRATAAKDRVLGAEDEALCDEIAALGEAAQEGEPQRPSAAVRTFLALPPWRDG